jgi:BirA family transcriptional regulator, biotin operon repressor / biotin---[acetyl-CoA-carboxylase] ligase
MDKNLHNTNNFANAQGKNLILKHIHFETIDSTNTWAKQHSDQWAPQGLTIIRANEQTAGRGRFKRQWHSPPGINLYLTFCFWLPSDLINRGHIPQLLALAVVEVLEKNQCSPKIKWPNDVLLNKKKVAGILCETMSQEDKQGMICGIGLNVNMSQEESQCIDRPATSLFIETGKNFILQMIQDALENYFANYLMTYFEKGFDPFFNTFCCYSIYQPGDVVHFHDNQMLIEAYFEQFNLDGSIQLRLTNGLLKNFYAGEFIYQKIV